MSRLSLAIRPLSSTLALGTYELLVVLADANATLATRPEYRVRFANTGASIVCFQVCQ